MNNSSVREKYERWRCKLCILLGVISVLDLIYVLGVTILMFKKRTDTLYNVLISGVPAYILLYIGMAVIFSAVLVLCSINMLVRYILEAFVDE